MRVGTCLNTYRSSAVADVAVGVNEYSCCAEESQHGRQKV